MDPLSASCVNLNSNPLPSRTLAQQKIDQKYNQILGSTTSVSKYEERNFRNLTPQIIAAILVTSYHIAIGISLAYSAIVIPQLKENPEFEVTENGASWIASIIALSKPIGSLTAGFLMDHFGRLKTLTMASVPGISGWVIIASSQNVYMLIAGRALVGFATAIGSSPAVVYLTEIARKDMRGSLISFAPALTSLGMILSFMMGWFLTWKQVAWLANIFIVIPCILVFFIPESPAWLVSHDKVALARKSLNWINKYQPKSLTELQLALLQKEHEMKKMAGTNNGRAKIIYEFGKPTGYKPMFILIGLFFFQQFSGIFIFLFYSITFFQEVGSTVNPYLTSVFIGIVRFAMSLVNTYTLKTFKRRPLVMISCFGMSLCIFLSGITSSLIKNNIITINWIPVIFLLLFVITSMIGVIPVPYSMTAELFPLEIRGVAQSVSTCLGSFIMFLSLQLYPTIQKLFGGICGVQYFFAGVSLAAVIFVYVVMPETHEMKLSEIEEYFYENVIFIGKKKEKKIMTTQNVVENEEKQKETLLSEVSSVI